MSSIYTINKSINKPIEFKGLKAQYIWWLGGGLLALLIVFATLYICGLNPFLCVVIILGSGAFWFMYVYRLSRRYGAHGMMKRAARRMIPKLIRTDSRKLFIKP